MPTRNNAKFRKFWVRARFLSNTLFGSPKFHWIRLEYLQCAKNSTGFFWPVRYTRNPVEIPVDFSSEKKSSRPQKIFGWIMYRSLIGWNIYRSQQIWIFSNLVTSLAASKSTAAPNWESWTPGMKHNLILVVIDIMELTGITRMAKRALAGLKLWMLGHGEKSLQFYYSALQSQMSNEVPVGSFWILWNKMDQLFGWFILHQKYEHCRRIGSGVATMQPRCLTESALVRLTKKWATLCYGQQKSLLLPFFWMSFWPLAQSGLY